MKRAKNSFKILALVLIVAIAYKLNIICIGICLSITLFFNVMLLKQKIIKQKHLNKFKDTILYMEQMIYSFKKQPKIRLALLDSQKVSSIEMKEIIEEVIVNIDSKMTDDIYESSLNIIQEEYDCKRLRSLHEFIIKIEKHGGDYEENINILLEDIKEWASRINLFMKDVDRVRRNVSISISSTLITCGFMAYLIPKDYGYVQHPIYQICSTIMIVLMLVTYTLITQKLNFDWTKEKKTLNDGVVVRYYGLIEKGYENQSKLSFMERITYKKAKKTLENEISKEFPDWLREVAMNLQNETVQSAIESSYENAAFVLKRPIRKLLIDFEKYPIEIEPYDMFLKEFDLEEIKSSMKMFYSMNSLGKEQSGQQINSIIDRNNKMVCQAEQMKNKDKIGVVGMLSAIPMMIGVGKIMIDMVLMIIIFTSSISNVVNGG